MNYTCSNKVIKYLMLVFNFFFVITGIIIIGVGVSVKTHYTDYDIFLDSKYFTLPNMLIATGSLIFFISLLGCFGAMRENWVMLMAFSVCLAIIFIFELSIGISGYVLRDKTSSYLEAEMKQSMDKYISTPAVSRMWDTIQSEFQCCGVINSTDWFNIFNNYSLPVSCCPDNSGTVGTFYCNAYPVSPITSVSTEATTASVPTEATTASVPTEATTASVTTDATTVSVTTDATTASPGNYNADQSLIKIDDGDVTTESTETNTTVTDTTVTVTSTQVTTTSNVTSSTVYPPSSSEPYNVGCETAFGNFVKKHAVDIGAVGIALAIIQLFGIVFSFHMARQLKNGYYST